MGRYALVKQSKVQFNGTVDIDYDFKKDFIADDYEPWLRKLVHGVMKKFSQNSRWDFDELMSEAWLALCESAEKFNPEYSNSLLGYAKQYILNRLHEFISVNMYTFKVRYYNIRHDEEKLANVNKMEANLWTDHKSKGNISSDGETFDTPLEAHSSGLLPVDEQLALNEQCGIIKNIVNKDLKKRERRAIVRRHRDEESFQEIGNNLGISKESARRTYIKGMEKLKTKAAKAGIKNE